MEIYVVRPGDSLYSIARSYGVSMSVLMADNQLPDPGRLVAGQTIVVRRPGRTYTVQRGDTLSSIARREETTVRSLLQNNPALRGEQEIFPGCPELRGNTVYLNGKPGLGIDFNEELAAKYPPDDTTWIHRWQMRLPDGTIHTP